MERLQAKWHPLSGVSPIAVESTQAKCRRIMSRLSAATQPPRLNKVSVAARTVPDRSTKSVTIPHVGQGTILKLFANTLGDPHSTEILPRAETSGYAPGSTTVDWILRAGDAVTRVIRLEESI